MKYEDKVDPQRITMGMRERLEAISYDVDQIDVLIDLAHAQVFNLKSFLDSHASLGIALDDWRCIFALLNIAKRELERIKETSEDFTTYKIEERARKVAANG